VPLFESRRHSQLRLALCFSAVCTDLSDGILAVSTSEPRMRLVFDESLGIAFDQCDGNTGEPWAICGAGSRY
jgi:hypothetical protein